MHLDGFSDNSVFHQPYFKVPACSLSCVPTETDDRWFVVNIYFLVIYVLCYITGPLIHLFPQMLKYVLPYKCNCIMISNTFNFLTLKNRPIRWRILYIQCL